MGETAAETMTEIDATRDRLDGELRLLEGRLPAAAKVAKRAPAPSRACGRAGGRHAIRAPKEREEGRRPPRPGPREASRQAGDRLDD